MRVGVNKELRGHLYIPLINNIPDYMPTPFRPPIGNTRDISYKYKMVYLEIKLGWFCFKYTTRSIRCHPWYTECVVGAISRSKVVAMFCAFLLSREQIRNIVILFQGGRF